MGSLQCAEDDVLVRGCEIDVCGAAASPPAGYGDEDFGEFFDEGGLLFGSDHDVAIAEFRGGEGCENTSAKTPKSRNTLKKLFNTKKIFPMKRFVYLDG